MENILLQVYFVIQKILYAQIDNETFNSIISEGKILEKDYWGVKVVETKDNKIVKFFRLKRVYSSAFFFPYAWCFKKNAEQLKKLGIKTVDVEKIVYCLPQQRHLLSYGKIEGQSARELLCQGDKNNDLIRRLITFIAELHTKGVYFRSLHFGNIIINSQGDMALIDISDLKVYSRGLSSKQRIRNWKHLLKYGFEKKQINDYGWDAFFSKYVECSHLSGKQVKQFNAAIKQ